MSTITSIPSSVITLIKNHCDIVNNENEDELENFPIGSIVGLSNDIGIVRTNYQIYKVEINQTNRDIMDTQQTQLNYAQANIIIKRYDPAFPTSPTRDQALTFYNDIFITITGITLKERRLVDNYLKFIINGC